MFKRKLKKQLEELEKEKSEWVDKCFKKGEKIQNLEETISKRNKEISSLLEIKAKVRKQTEADLLLTSIKIILDITNVKKSVVGVSELQTRQMALGQQMRSLAASPLGSFWGLKGR